MSIHNQGDSIGPDGAFAELFHQQITRRNVVGQLTGLLEKARAAGASIIYTRIAFAPGFSDLVPNSPLLQMVQQAGCLVDGTDSAAIIQRLIPGPGDAVITNQQVGGFGTELAGLLESGGIDTLLIAGVATNISVESTARAAVDHGCRVVIVEDACSAAAEAAHAASIESLGLLATITGCADIQWDPAAG
ncbi:nicotinamidase-related amidase [Glutamicibacter mysorens]|uniref:Nicotinamidase-related amidase n=2 Tax=Glutamicibacter mysorens TaxID=257984 RepID=A0ABX4N2H7_9MICC|nr:nicotinamidase-related amidase [Glutamicibacter mysorens]